MKVTLWMTITLNGIIATSDYNEDFSSHDNWNEFVKAVKDKGCLIWGRKTYEMVGGWSKSYLETLEKFPKVIVSSNKNLELRPGFILANSPENALKTLEKMGFVEVILTGGSKNNSSFAKLNLIDEIILDVEPAILGKGIPLFDPEDFDLRLKLLKVNKVSNSIIQLRYEVIR